MSLLRQVAADAERLTKNADFEAATAVLLAVPDSLRPSIENYDSLVIRIEALVEAHEPPPPPQVHWRKRQVGLTRYADIVLPI